MQTKKGKAFYKQAKLTDDEQQRRHLLHHTGMVIFKFLIRIYGNLTRQRSKSDYFPLVS